MDLKGVGFVLREIIVVELHRGTDFIFVIKSTFTYFII